jgi:hypothetical protein
MIRKILSNLTNILINLLFVALFSHSENEAKTKQKRKGKTDEKEAIAKNIRDKLEPKLSMPIDR